MICTTDHFRFYLVYYLYFLFTWLSFQLNLFRSETILILNFLRIKRCIKRFFYYCFFRMLIYFINLFCRLMCSSQHSPLLQYFGLVRLCMSRIFCEFLHVVINQCSSNFFHRDPFCTAKFFRDP